MDDKTKIILAYNTFRNDLRDNTIKPKIMTEFRKRNKSTKRLQELSDFMDGVYAGKQIDVIPEEIRLTLKEMRLV